MKGGIPLKDYSAEDRAMREKLERNSSAGQRVNMAGMVNQLVKVHDKRALPGMSAYGVIRLLQNNGGAQARAARRHNRAHEEFLERLHPDSTLRRAVEQVRDAPGSMNGDGRTRGDFEPGKDVISIEGMRAMAMAAVLRRYW
jgi:predicted YcjX-like family ATPase